MAGGEETTDKSGSFFIGIITGIFIGAAIVAGLWVISIPHFDTMPDLEMNPCMGWGTTNGEEFPTPTDQWYNEICPNRTLLVEGKLNPPIYRMHIEEACRCYEYKNWWKFVKPPSMFR